MFVKVSTFTMTFDDQGLTYMIPDFLSGKLLPGQIVEVPIREIIELALVLEINTTTDVSDEKIKPIISIVYDEAFLYDYQLKLIPWIASHYFTAIHNSLNLFFPKNTKEKIGKIKYKFLQFNNLKFTSNLQALNNAQEGILDNIRNEKNKNIFLYGVTGSGKTEIYFHLIHTYLEQNKQSLFLVPEIVLTNQLSDRMKAVFGESIIIINSSVSEATKTNYFQQIQSGTAKIIIGTRSALFYPYKDLGLIIIDEEHDASFVSDQAPRYHSIEVAEKISDLTGARLVLGSGTPSIKNMYRAIKGKYKLLQLLKKWK